MLRQHWTRDYRLKKRWATLVQWAKFELPRRPQAPLERARVLVTRYSPGSMDIDNLYGSVKHLLDALIVNGFIVDDSAKHIELQVKQVKDNRKRTFVMIEPLTA
jgi:Holliday junction resolvase RusA-like endonuclease